MNFVGSMCGWLGGLVIWFGFSCLLMSFIEHQIHSHLMHSKKLSDRFSFFRRTFEAHALDHHKHYSKIFTDQPVPVGEDREIRLTVRKAPIKAAPFAALIALVSWQGAIIFLITVVFHHIVWNKIHLEMHKPEGRSFSNWPIYRFLARYHYLHHRYPNKNLNVVFPFADYVLGTRARASAADRLAMEALGLYGGAPSVDAGQRASGGVVSAVVAEKRGAVEGSSLAGAMTAAVTPAMTAAVSGATTPAKTESVAGVQTGL